jgi:hypothetical protein
MEQGPQDPPPEQSENPEKQSHIEIENLPVTLGFVETPELRQLRDEVVQAITAGDEKRAELLARYESLAQDVVNQHSDTEHYIKAQIGLIIQIGLIRRAGEANYQNDLEDAAEYAWNARLDDLAAFLDEAIENIRNQSENEG